MTNAYKPYVTMIDQLYSALAKGTLSTVENDKFAIELEALWHQLSPAEKRVTDNLTDKYNQTELERI
jgi:hypothetical protein